MTIYTGYILLVKAHEDGASPALLNTIIFAVLGMLLDIDFSEGFKCNTCGNDPQALIMDTTELSSDGS